MQYVQIVWNGTSALLRTDPRPEPMRRACMTVSTRKVNQDGKEVMSFERTKLIYETGHSPEADES
jgi:itaconyl-CoA hydratase